MPDGPDRAVPGAWGTSRPSRGDGTLHHELQEVSCPCCPWKPLPECQDGKVRLSLSLRCSSLYPVGFELCCCWIPRKTICWVLWRAGCSLQVTPGKCWPSAAGFAVCAAVGGAGAVPCAPSTMLLLSACPAQNTWVLGGSEGFFLPALPPSSSAHLPCPCCPSWLPAVGTLSVLAAEGGGTLAGPMGGDPGPAGVQGVARAQQGRAGKASSAATFLEAWSNASSASRSLLLITLRHVRRVLVAWGEGTFGCQLEALGKLLPGTEWRWVLQK